MALSFLFVNIILFYNFRTRNLQRQSVFFASCYRVASSTLSNWNLKNDNLAIFWRVAFVYVTRKTRRTIKCARAVFTGVNFTCMDSCMSIKAPLIGESITANVTNKCLWSHGVVKDVLRAVCQTPEHFATVLTRIRPIIVVIVHMFPKVGFTSECFVADFAHKLSLTVTDRTARSRLAFHGRCDGTIFAVLLDARFWAVWKLRFALNGRLRRGWFFFVRRTRSVPSSVRCQVSRAAENFVAFWASIFSVLNSATLVLSKRKWIRVHLLAELADKLRLWQRSLGFRKVVLVRDGKLLMFENCGFATMICVSFVKGFASANVIFAPVVFVAALD